MAFIAAITAEVAKNSGLLKKPTNVLTDAEIQTAEKVPLDVLVTRHPDIYEKIRDTVYESSRENGEYVDNHLHLVYKKSDSVPPHVVDFNMVDNLPGRLAKSTNGQEKLAIKNEILTALSKLKKKAKQNRDAVAMRQVGIYYKKFHEHDEAIRCYSRAEEFKGKANHSATIITPPAKPSGEPILDTNLTWRLDDDGTLTISGKGDMSHCHWKTKNSWPDKRALIQKVVIEPGVTSVSDLAFDGCKKFTKVKIPGNVKKIGKNIFTECKKLQSIRYKRGLNDAEKLRDGNKAILIPY